MHHMVLLVLNNPDECADVLDAWEAAGVHGVTILESTGLGRLRNISNRDDLPLMPSLMNLMRSREEHHRTLFTVVEGEEKVEEIINATLGVVGTLDAPHKGVLFVLPVSRVVGMRNGPDEKF